MSFVPQSSSYTAQQVVNEVRRTLGDLPGVLFTNDDALSWVNAGQREIGGKLDLFGEADFPLVADDGSYVIPVEISKRIRDIQTIVVDEKRLDSLSYVQAQQRWMQADGPGLPAAGTPRYWYARNQTVYLVPAPSAEQVADTPTATVQFTRQPLDLVDLAATLDVPDTHYNLLVSYVRSRAYLVTQETELAQLSQAEVESGFRDEKRRERRSQTNTNFAIEPDEELY